jgi:16S rRNA (guanine527-N7)-methyltransferase
VLAAGRRDWLLATFEQAKFLGLVGPGPVDSHVDHALGYAAVIGSPPRRALDLGTGAGLPGLVLALLWPDSHWLLVDGSVKRGNFLSHRLTEAPFPNHANAVVGRAEELARSPLRQTMDLVVARSFGPPAVVAECGAPFLAPAGQLVVSAPPGEPQRWPAAPLSALGLEVSSTVPGPPAFQVLRQALPCPPRYPRRVGIPAKRPLF